jgi:hypothetical protein
VPSGLYDLISKYGKGSANKETFMNQAKIFADYSALPPEAQKLVADLVAFLNKQHRSSKRRAKAKPTRLTDENFIGIWKDRDEMQDSTAYVRELRRHEWT